MLLAAVWLLLASPRSHASSDLPASDVCPSIIYVARRGWHIDVGFAVESLSPPLDGIAQKFPGARYVFFGFGDRRYLMASHQTMPAMLRALWPGAGVILVTGLGAPPGAAFGAAHVVELRVNSPQARAAQIYVWHSLAVSGDSAKRSPPVEQIPVAQIDVPTLAPGPYPGSLYLAASSGYSAIHTCNTWAAEVLHSANLPIRSRGILLAGQVWRRATKLAGESGRPVDVLNCRVASFHSDKLPWSQNRAVPRPWSSPVVADCCC